MEELDPLAGLDQFLLGQLAGPLGLLHHRPQLLQLRLQEVVPPLHDGDVLLQVLVDPHRVVQLQLGVLRGGGGEEERVSGEAGMGAEVHPASRRGRRTFR